MRRRLDIPHRARCLGALALATIAGACQPRSSSVGDLADQDAPPPPQTLSRFYVPIEYDFTPVMATVERVVPRKFGSMAQVRDVPNDTRRKYAFEATRGPFTAFVVGSQVHLRTTLSYTARGFYKPVIGPTVSAGCGSDKVRPRIVVELITPLTLDSTWHLKSRARVGTITRASKRSEDQCQVSVLRLDVTDKVEEAARTALTAQLPEINKRIAGVSLANQAAGWWTSLNKPIRLRDDVWLLLHPAKLRLGKITGAKRTLTIEAGVDAYPKIVTGAEPAVVMSPLPALAGVASAGGFNIVLDGNIGYATISTTLTDLLGGKTIGVKGREIVVDSVRAAGRSRGRIELAVTFSGDAEGTIHFAGTPKFDAQAGEILVPDLDYDLDTDNGLVAAVAWVKSDDLRTMMRDKARIPVAPVLDRGRQLLTSGLNRTIGTSLTLSADVDSVAVHDLYVRRPGIVVRAAALGSAKVAVRQQAAPRRATTKKR
jgi:hypothetical protein